MDTAENKIARLEASIARAGEVVTFERLNTDPTTGVSTVEMVVSDVPAWIRSSAPQDLIDSEAKNMRVVVSPTRLLEPVVGSPPAAFGIPQRDDRIIIQGSPANVQQIDPIYYGGILVRINLLCRG